MPIDRTCDHHPGLPLDPDAEAGASRYLRLASLSLVALGGIAGTAARYGVSLGLPSTDGRWPAGTFTVNVVGAFMLGALIEALGRRGPDDGWRRRLRLLLGTGFCGAFTTYSTLAVETDLLVRSHATALALGYGLGSPVAGLVATAAGIVVAARHHQWLTARSAS